MAFKATMLKLILGTPTCRPWEVNICFSCWCNLAPEDGFIAHFRFFFGGGGTLVAFGSSWAWNWTPATAVTQAAAVTTSLSYWATRQLPLLSVFIFSCVLYPALKINQYFLAWPWCLRRCGKTKIWLSLASQRRIAITKEGHIQG